MRCHSSASAPDKICEIYTFDCCPRRRSSQKSILSCNDGKEENWRTKLFFFHGKSRGREDALSETKYHSRNYSGRALSRNITRNTNNRLALYYNRIRNIHININIMRNTKNRIQEKQNDSDEISNLILAVITNYGYTILFVRVYKTLSDLA